jgi:hypothetical protein
MSAVLMAREDASAIPSNLGRRWLGAFVVATLLFGRRGGTGHRLRLARHFVVIDYCTVASAGRARHRPIAAGHGNSGLIIIPVLVPPARIMVMITVIVSLVCHAQVSPLDPVDHSLQTTLAVQPMSHWLRQF